MDIKFKEISRRKGTLADIPLEDRESWCEYGLEPREIEVVNLEVQMDIKKIPIYFLKVITQEAISEQKFERVNEYINEITGRGYEVLIKDKF
jgi:hypothetical protein